MRRWLDGICSNYLCDLKKGDVVNVIGPFGGTFLMPNHPNSHLLMICTGTGSAPMRAMTEYRRRRRLKGATGKLMLFFGARTKEELPYFGPLTNLPKDFIDTNLAFSRTPASPPARSGGCDRPRGHQVIEGHDLGLDEAALEISVDDAGNTKETPGAPNADVCLHSDNEAFLQFYVKRVPSVAVSKLVTSSISGSERASKPERH